MKLLNDNLNKILLIFLNFFFANSNDKFIKNSISSFSKNSKVFSQINNLISFSLVKFNNFPIFKYNSISLNEFLFSINKSFKILNLFSSNLI
jgi:hypothetical protein